MSGGDVFTVGSLFSGIGGLELGLEMTGRFKTVWQVEQNEYCRKVLRKHWPDAIQFEDVRNVGRENLPAVDVICGGFPCQDVSLAGKRAGLAEGTRSGLWYQFARIIRELRPRYAIVENVPGLLSDGMGTVLGDLAELGYDADWTVLSAAEVGAPHLRQRVFAVAYAPSLNVAWGRHPSSDQRHTERNASISERCAINASHADSSGLAERNVTRNGATSPSRIVPRSEPLGARSTPRREHWEAEPGMDRVANGIPDRVERITALGNAVVPQCARVIGEWLLEIDAELNERGVA